MSLGLFLIPFYFCILFLITSFIFYKIIYSKHKIHTSNLDLSELLLILNVVINTELDLYEKDVFNTKGAITNANFENFYNDIVHNIINSLSDDFFNQISIFIKKEALVSIICRNVKKYLTDKVNGTT